MAPKRVSYVEGKRGEEWNFVETTCEKEEGSAWKWTCQYDDDLPRWEYNKEYLLSLAGAGNLSGSAQVNITVSADILAGGKAQMDANTVKWTIAQINQKCSRPLKNSEAGKLCYSGKYGDMMVCVSNLIRKGYAMTLKASYREFLVSNYVDRFYNITPAISIIPQDLIANSSANLTFDSLTFGITILDSCWRNSTLHMTANGSSVAVQDVKMSDSGRVTGALSDFQLPTEQFEFAPIPPGECKVVSGDAYDLSAVIMRPISYEGVGVRRHHKSTLASAKDGGTFFRVSTFFILALFTSQPYIEDYSRRLVGH